MATVHVLYNGRTQDIPLEQMFPPEHFAEIGLQAGALVTAANLTQEQVKKAAAQHFDVAETEFQDHFVELNPNGNITIRPSTPFGK